METFKDIINGNKPVLVDFHAIWCGPCKMMEPIIDSLGKEMQGDVRILKIDIDKNPAVATQYQVQAVPTFIIFKQGQIMWRHPGAIDKVTLHNQLKSLL